MTWLQRFCLASTFVASVFGGRTLAEPTASPPSPAYEATFKPLLGSERDYAALGPAGPFYPQAALSHDGPLLDVVRGEAILECRIARLGELDDRKIISARPLKVFGVAARVMASRRRVVVTDGPPDGQVVRVHVPFDPSTTAQVAP